MAGDALEPMPMSPRQSPAQLGSAMVQWAMSRRGRVFVVAAVFLVVLLGFAGVRHTESISSSYDSITTNYHLPSWRPYLPHLPSVISSTPLKPSNTTLELENGDIEKVPSSLTKTSPSFHLLMPSLDDNPDFCKTTLSAMMLGYPPPTVINLFQTFDSQMERERERLKSILGYLEDEKLVKDEDLLLIVDGHDTWFQLPPEVVIRQYQNVLNEANKKLGERYGLNDKDQQRFNQTIVFGAVKSCQGDDMACKYVPPSTLPHNIYGQETGSETDITAAKYLDSGMLMGPAKDLKTLYEAAVRKFEDKNSQSPTVQSVFATIFGEQQLARDAESSVTSEKKPSSPLEKATQASKWLDWFGGQAAEPATTSSGEEKEGAEAESSPSPSITLDQAQHYEFAVGLDYTHSLFQPFLYSASGELVPLKHDDSDDLSAHHHPDTPTAALTLPSVLDSAKPPFWTPDLSAHNPSPNTHPAYIDKLAIDRDLDHLKPRDTSWAAIPLVQNTYTGAIPAVLHLNAPTLPSPQSQSRRRIPRNPRIPSADAHHAPTANLSWSSLWYAGYERALLRRYFRAPMSPEGYHTAAVGGDRLWDQRGGRGGVWTEKEGLWMPWGEVDGVCGSLKQVKEVFGDGRGVWLHEKDEDGEGERRKEEEELAKKIKEEREKDEERKKKEEEERKKKEDEERKKKEEEEKKKEEEEKKKKEEEERKGEEKEKQEAQQKAGEKAKRWRA